MSDQRLYRIDTAAVRKAIESGEPIPDSAVVLVDELPPPPPRIGRWGRVIPSELESLWVQEFKSK